MLDNFVALHVKKHTGIAPSARRGLDWTWFILIAECQRLHPATLALDTLSYRVLSSLLSSIQCLLGFTSYLALLLLFIIIIMQFLTRHVSVG